MSLKIQASYARNCFSSARRASPNTSPFEFCLGFPVPEDRHGPALRLFQDSVAAARGVLVLIQSCCAVGTGLAWFRSHVVG
jgi:hypothetical protein